MSSLNNIEAYVEAHWPEIQNDIEALVAIDSVRNDEQATPEMPFGLGPHKALCEVARIAKAKGLETSHDNYCCVADLKGETEKQIAVVSHVDVVPAGPGWNYEPFAVTEREGYLIGRGVEDDKGPGVLSLWCAKYFIDNNIVPKHTLRFIFGSDEESGMGAIKKYVKENLQPDFMFTPDAEFPVICGEKGIFHALATIPFPLQSRVVSLKGGVARNAVAGACESVVRAQLNDLTSAEGIELEGLTEDEVLVRAHGVSGHASLPEGTVSAIGKMIEYLKQTDIIQECDRAWFGFMEKLFADSYGKALGIATEQEFLGELTCVGGMCELADGKLTQSIDIRHPQTITTQELVEAFEKELESCEGVLEVLHTEGAHLVDPQDPCVQALTKAYCEVSKKEATPIAIGGGTYAKRFKHSVAFGPVEIDEVKPEWAGNMHGPDESISIAQLKQALVVYIRSLENLFELDL